VFLLLDLSLPDLTTTPWAEGMTFTESLPTLGTGQLKAGFEMFYGNGALRKIYVLNL